MHIASSKPNASVCGYDGLRSKLQFYTEKYLTPRRCLPSLAARLMADQGRRIAAALSAAEPFGIVLASDSGGELVKEGLMDPTDLYQPVGDGMYRGVDSGLNLFACEPTVYGQVLAISDSASGDERSQCTGQLWVDLRGGGMYPTRPQGGDLGSLGAGTLPVTYTFGWASCAAWLPSVGLGDLSGDFATNVSSPQVACWLGRMFGPQARRAITPTTLQLPVLTDPVHLVTGLIVPSGAALAIHGQNTTLIVGRHQLYVPADAHLEMRSMIVAESIESSAMWIDGSADLKACIIRDCTTRMNAAIRLAEEAANTGSAFMVAGGGAAIVFGSIELTGSFVSRCTAEDGIMMTWGGASPAFFGPVGPAR